MIVDGRKIAKNIYNDISNEVSLLKEPPRLTVFTCAPNFETEKYLKLKKNKAKSVGIDVEVVDVDEKSTTEDFIKTVAESAGTTDGIIVQLPLPAHIDTEKVVKSVPEYSDVDSLNPNTKDFLSPVVGSIKAILETYSIDTKDKNILVIGNGKLVGAPTYKWFKEHDAHTQKVTASTTDVSINTKEADIIVCGTGVPGLLQSDMIKEGVVILDAGTSEDGGELKGDASPDCEGKCSLFTPVPGGVGPITIAILLQNVLLAKQKTL